MKRAFGIRLKGDVVEKIDVFASKTKLSPTAAAEFFVERGIESFEKTGELEERLDKIEEVLNSIKTNLKSMQKTNYKALVYLCMSAGKNPEIFVEAEQAAEKNIAEIFGE